MIYVKWNDFTICMIHAQCLGLLFEFLSVSWTGEEPVPTGREDFPLFEKYYFPFFQTSSAGNYAHRRRHLHIPLCRGGEKISNSRLLFSFFRQIIIWQYMNDICRPAQGPFQDNSLSHTPAFLLQHFMVTEQWTHLLQLMYYYHFGKVFHVIIILWPIEVPKLLTMWPSWGFLAP